MCGLECTTRSEKREADRQADLRHIIIDIIGEGTDVATGIDGGYSYLVKRIITVCGVCCAFQCHRIMYNSLFTTLSSVVKH